MPMIRLIYFSENQINPATTSVTRELSSILSASNRNNKQSEITGALVFDDQWFIQALEGERERIWSTFERIKDDERHAGVVIAEVVDIHQKIFANWWMGLAARDGQMAHAFAPYLLKGRLDPRQLTGTEMLGLMTAVARIGLHRTLADTLPA